METAESKNETAQSVVKLEGEGFALEIHFATPLILDLELKPKENSKATLIDRINELDELQKKLRENPITFLKLDLTLNMYIIPDKLWIFIMFLLGNFKTMEKLNAKRFGFFFREHGSKYGEWYQSLRLNTMRIGDIAEDNNWDFLINIKTLSDNNLKDSQCKELLKVLEEVSIGFPCLERFYFVLITNNREVNESFCLKCSLLFSKLDSENLKGFGQYIFKPDLGDEGYMDLIKIIPKFKRLEELLFVITDCTDEEMTLFSQAMIQDHKKSLHTLRLYTGSPKVSYRGLEQLIQVFMAYSSQLRVLGWAFWHITDNEYQVKLEVFDKIFEVIGSFKMLNDLRFAFVLKKQDTNFLEMISNSLMPLKDNLISFGLYHDLNVKGHASYLKLLASCLALTNLNHCSKVFEMNINTKNYISQLMSKRKLLLTQLHTLNSNKKIRQNLKRKRMLIEISEMFWNAL